ncbi:glycosyltransferase family 39 protein, partial [bacterium]|nr:glycosyltransferase family 39 protein [bacterium]
MSTDTAVGTPRFSIGAPITRPEILWIAGMVTLFLVVCANVIMDGGPLGHDESVYALRAQDFRLGAEAGPYWSDIRAPGLPYVAQMAWILSGTEPYLRIVTTGFGALLMIVTWLFGRAVFSPGAGLIAAAGIGTTPFIVRASVQVWPDVPGAAVGLAALALFAFATSGERASWWIMGVPMLVAGATYLRYGAPLQLVVGFIAIAIWRWKVVRAGLIQVGLAGAASAVVVWLILRVPWFTGARTAPQTAIGSRARQWFEGFDDYLGSLGELFGSVSSLGLLAGLVLAVLWIRKSDLDRRAVYAIGGAGLGTLIVTATVLHGELRYLSPAFPFLWMVAGAGLVPIARWVPRAAVPALGAVLAIVLVVSTTAEGSEINDFARSNYSDIKQASLAIGELADDRACGVVTSYVPQV